MIRRRLPAQFGRRPIYVSPDSALSYLKFDWNHAADLFSAVANYVRPSDNIWDVGGNVGVFTIASAHIAGPEAEVVTLEADPFLASLLQKSAAHSVNADRRINIVCAAASDEVGLAKFMIAERGVRQIL